MKNKRAEECRKWAELHRTFGDHEKEIYWLGQEKQYLSNLNDDTVIVKKKSLLNKIIQLIFNKNQKNICNNQKHHHLNKPIKQ